MGVYAALRRGSFEPAAFMTLSLLGVSLPTFLIGILLILVFAVTVWAGFRASAAGEVIELGAWSTGLLTAKGWQHITLPAITLAVFQLTLIMRLVRAEMLEVLRTDYIKFARARGLSDRAIHFGHALKNTLVPVMTITGLQLGGLIAFAIITETGIPVARHGTAFHSGGDLCRHPGDGRLPVPDRTHLRGHQPGGGPAVLCRRSAPAGGPGTRRALSMRIGSSAG
jgi:ABC-type antimicrobial peptide transport system permease subunit